MRKEEKKDVKEVGGTGSGRRMTWQEILLFDDFLVELIWQ